jgi:hypothetical protein
MMKKLFIILMVVAFLALSFSTVIAAGGQVQGGTGNGKGSQETFEKGCVDQPCYDENADQPGPFFP